MSENAGCTDLCGENDDSPMALGLSQSVQMSLSKTRVSQDSVVWNSICPHLEVPQMRVQPPPFTHKPHLGAGGLSPHPPWFHKQMLQGEEDARKRNTEKMKFSTG